MGATRRPSRPPVRPLHGWVRVDAGVARVVLLPFARAVALLSDSVARRHRLPSSSARPRLCPRFRAATRARLRERPLTRMPAGAGAAAYTRNAPGKDPPVVVVADRTRERGAAASAATEPLTRPDRQRQRRISPVFEDVRRAGSSVNGGAAGCVLRCSTGAALLGILGAFS